MKHRIIFLVPLLLALNCKKENPMPETFISTRKLLSEEYFIPDSTNSGPVGFVRSYKKKYRYDQNKLVGIDVYDFNPYTHSYDSGYKYEEFRYTSEGKLSQSIQFIGTSGLSWIKEYEYLNTTSVRVTRYEANHSGAKKLSDWWVMDKTPSTLTVKYYQGNNEMYAQLIYAIDKNGNVTSVARYPSFPSGNIYYEHDQSPNPYKFSVLSGEYGFDSEKYISENNSVTVTNDLGKKSTSTIEYNADKYPNTISSAISKRTFTYQ